MGDLPQPARPDAIRARLVFLYLLVGNAERVPKLLLAHCKHHAAPAYLAANVSIDGVRGLFGGNCIAKRHGGPLAKAISKNHPEAQTFEFPIQRAIFGRSLSAKVFEIASCQHRGICGGRSRPQTLDRPPRWR